MTTPSPGRHKAHSYGAYHNPPPPPSHTPLAGPQLPPQHTPSPYQSRTPYSSDPVHHARQPPPPVTQTDPHGPRLSPSSLSRQDSGHHVRHGPGPGYSTPVEHARPSPAEPHPLPPPGEYRYQEHHHHRESMDQAPHYSGHPTLAQHLVQQQHPLAPQHGMQPPPVDTSMHHSYPAATQSHSTPQTPWDQQYAYGYDQLRPGEPPKRKAVRAAQACENCRTKKAKCDEQRPSCGNCEQNGVKCEYRNLPPPKQDRSLMQLTDVVTQLVGQVQVLTQTQQQMQLIQQQMVDKMPNINSGEQQDRPNGSAVVKLRASPNGTPSTTSNSNHDQYQSPVYNLGSQNHTMSRITSQDGVKPNVRALDRDSTQTVFRSASGRTGQYDYVNIQTNTEQDMLKGELSIPPVHSTAAHDLRGWSKIKGFFKDIPLKYVKRGEYNHNLDLSSHTRNYRNDTAGARRTHSSPATVDRADFDDTSSTLSSTDSRPAAAFVNLFTVEGSRGAQPSPGGRNPNQSLSVDRETALRLLQSYLDNIHILQPFINRRWLGERVNQFIRHYCSEPTETQASPRPIPEHLRHDSAGPSNGSKKRKLSYGLHSDSAEAPNRSAGTKKAIHRTIDNALVLLIFALGRICEHKGPLPAPKPQHETNAAGHSYSPANSASSPNQPALYTPPSGVGTPKLEHSPNPHGDLQIEQGEYSENIDLIPGIAYYAHAVSIIGEVFGANSLQHVQARLLAGLYTAQLVRVYDSWKWINSACITWLALFKTHDDNPESLSDAERLTYWACLICESDILAELELPPSYLSKLEDLIPVRTIGNDENEDLVIQYFAQISIRKILNRAHSALYNVQKSKPGEAQGHGWARLNSEQLAIQLDDWRRTLPVSLRWNDNDPPANTINHARLRGKYWGARNIIFRPFLHRAINGNLPAEAQVQAKDEETRFQTEKKTFDHAFQCIEAARESTLAFDGVPGMPERLIVTNIFGTAHAQFGNMLVLGAACLSPTTGPHFPQGRLLELLERTVNFLGYLAPLSPTMTTNIKVLKQIEAQVNGEASVPPSANTSFATS